MKYVDTKYNEFELDRKVLYAVISENIVADRPQAYATRPIGMMGTNGYKKMMGSRTSACCPELRMPHYKKCHHVNWILGTVYVEASQLGKRDDFFCYVAPREKKTKESQLA